MQRMLGKPVGAAVALATIGALGASLCAAGVKSWSTTRSPLSAAPPVSARTSDPNQVGTYWTNLLVASSRLHDQWRHAETERSARLALEDGAEFAAANGFGAWGLYEFGPRTVVHERSGWDRPIHQFSDLTPMHQEALRDAIAHAKRLGLEVHGYIGTLDRSGEDVAPAPTDLYLDELTLMADAGFDRIYIDATSWNSNQTNDVRDRGVGGGRRRDGVLAIREELAARGIDLEVAMEAWPMEDGRILTETGPALIAGAYLGERREQGRMDLENNPFGGDCRVVLFNLHQDAANIEALTAAADAGYVFDAGDRTPQLIELVRLLNERAGAVRTRLGLPDRDAAPAAQSQSAPAPAASKLAPRTHEKHGSKRHAPRTTAAPREAPGREK